mmetsp:Transcript_33423/g.51307  ORF Transcript_33423/g.51307 Transcript_33423/m.51307 type:complete len:113 (+) Transcript_33423:1114-1452(+)
MHNIRERRKRMQQSQIFDGSEKKGAQEETEEKEVSDEAVDLTAQQVAKQRSQGSIIDDEMDILDAYISPLDNAMWLKRQKLKTEIEDEKIRIKCKYLFKHGLREGDPFKIFV